MVCGRNSSRWADRKATIHSAAAMVVRSARGIARSRTSRRDGTSAHSRNCRRCRSALPANRAGCAQSKRSSTISPPMRVFLNNALGVLRRHVAVHRPFGIHHADRSFHKCADTGISGDQQGPSRPVMSSSFSRSSGSPRSCRPCPDLHAVRTNTDEQVARKLSNTERGGCILGRLILSLPHNRIPNP